MGGKAGKTAVNCARTQRKKRRGGKRGEPRKIKSA